MKILGDKVKFESTGIEQHANCGIIGIDSELRISGGYDDCSITRVWEKDDDRELNKKERQELAEYMIGLWQKYAAL